jgi:hypothetical protein
MATPSPRKFCSPDRAQSLRAHSPWTALRQRKKGRQDVRETAPMHEFDENRAPAGAWLTTLALLGRKSSIYSTCSR